MSAWNVVLFLVSLFPLCLSIYYISMFMAQGRKHWRQINYLVLVASLLVFAHQCWQVAFFRDEGYYRLIPFPQDYFSHTYLFVLPAILGLMIIPKMYANMSKLLYTCLLLSVILASLALFAYPGKDLIWFSINLSILLVFIGLKEDSFPLHYRHFVKYIFLENTWVALFYFKSQELFLVALLLQLAAKYYFYQLLNLFWIQNFLKKNQNNPVEVKPLGGLIKE